MVYVTLFELAIEFDARGTSMAEGFMKCLGYCTRMHEVEDLCNKLGAHNPHFRTILVSTSVIWNVMSVVAGSIGNLQLGR